MTPEQALQFGAYLRIKREDHGLSLRGLAGLTGVEMTTISRLEQGKSHTPNPERLRRIAHVLDIPVNDLFVMANYVEPNELPTPRPYLRAKFPDLPQEAVDQADRYLANLMREHGVVTDGPLPGEDE